MKLPDEVRAWLARRYQNQHRDWLAAPAPGWPLSIPLGAPTEAQALRQPDAVRAWADSWRHWRGAGELRWAQRRWKVLGSQQLPEALLLHGPGQVALWIGEQDRWGRAVLRHALLAARWPAIDWPLATLYPVLADYDEDDFQRLLDLAAWLLAHRQSGLYPRQIPLPGIDSKWLESRRGVVGELVAALRGGAGAGGNFYELCGLRQPPAVVRMRVLDAGLRARLGGLDDVSAPVQTLARLDWQPSTVLIVENLQTGLALHDLPGAVAFMGLGYGVDVLAALPWIAPAACYYWGDIDTHGYAILHRARSILPQLQSVMMDRQTLLRFLALCTTEKSQCGATDLSTLTAAERDVNDALRGHALGQSLRLEQERIAWDIAWPRLKAAL